MFYSQRSTKLFSFSKPYAQYLPLSAVNKINEKIEFVRGKGDVNSELQNIGLEIGEHLGGDMYSIKRKDSEPILNVELESMRNGRFIARHLNVQIPEDAEPLHKETQEEQSEYSESFNTEQLKLFE